MGLVQTYGLFWRTDQIYWGAGKNPGALLGVPTNNITMMPVDFRDQRGVYVLYADYELVYVGQNSNQELIARLKQHFKDDLADRWNRFSWFGVRRVIGNGQLSVYKQGAQAAMNAVLDHMEAILIHAAEPRMNRQGGRFGEAVQQYLQHRDERLGITDRERLQQIHEQLVKQS